MVELLNKQIEMVLQVIQSRHAISRKQAEEVMARALASERVMEEFVYEADLQYLNQERVYTYHYPAVFEYQRNGEIRITFPDFKNAQTYAISFDEAQYAAKRLLNYLIEKKAEREENLPKPSDRKVVESNIHQSQQEILSSMTEEDKLGLDVIKTEVQVVSVIEKRVDAAGEIQKQWDSEDALV